MYAAEKGNPDTIPCDSGVTNYFFMPHVVKKAYASFGYDCIYISNSQIKKDFRAVMNAIKASVDKGIPVLAWGMGNVTMNSGNLYNPLPEGCLIGGYDENDVLYVNLYPNKDSPDRLPNGAVDDDGFCTITNGLDTTNGLFFVGKKLENFDMRQSHQDIINAIPTYLTLPVFESYMGGKYAFGKAAFDVWADTLEDDTFFENKTDKEMGDIRWNLHCSPFCSLCTTHAHNFIVETVEKFPDITIATKLLPLYKHMADCKDAIWKLHDGFEPPLDSLRSSGFRVLLAKIIREIGEVCSDILNVFEAQTGTAVKQRALWAIDDIHKEIDVVKTIVADEKRNADVKKRQWHEEHAKCVQQKYDEFDKLFPCNKTVAVDLATTETKNWVQAAHDNGVMTLSNTGSDRGRAHTQQVFGVPIKIDIRVKISDTHLQLLFHRGDLTFHREENYKTLRIKDIENKEERVYENIALPIDEFVDVEWICARDFMAVRVNGELRHLSSDYEYIYAFHNKADYEFSSPISICCFRDSMITVETLRVTEI